MKMNNKLILKNTTHGVSRQTDDRKGTIANLNRFGILPRLIWIQSEPRVNKFAIAVLSIALFFIATLTGCTRYQEKIQSEIIPEPELYAMAMGKYNEKAWDDAISTFNRYEALYISGPHIQEIRLKKGDAYFNKDTISAYILAKSEYQNFLSLYPRYENEDYVWLQIAKCSVKQMLPPNRDQSPTESAIKDLENFLSRFPDSQYVPEARLYLKQAYDNKAEHNYVVGMHYFGRGIFHSAAERFKDALKLNADISNPEDLLYKLSYSLAKGADYYSKYYNFLSFSKQDVIKNYYKERSQTFLYEAKQYLQEYQDKYPENTGRISELQNEINLVTPINNEPEQKESVAQ